MHELIFNMDLSVQKLFGFFITKKMQKLLEPLRTFQTNNIKVFKSNSLVCLSTNLFLMEVFSFKHLNNLFQSTINFNLDFICQKTRKGLTLIYARLKIV